MGERLARAEEGLTVLKWSVSAFGVAIALLAATFAGVTSINVSSQMDRMGQVQTEVREELARLREITRTSVEIQVLGTDGVSIEGRDVPATYVPKGSSGNPEIVFLLFLKNTGLDWSGPISARLFTTDPIRLMGTSFEESQFPYELYFPIGGIGDHGIPGQAAVSFPIVLTQRDAHALPKEGRFDVALRFYYGKGRFVRQAFTLRVAGK
jgi:hypothetical protein